MKMNDLNAALLEEPVERVFCLIGRSDFALMGQCPVWCAGFCLHEAGGFVDQGVDFEVAGLSKQSVSSL